MFARLASFTGSAGALLEGARIYEEEIVPWLSDANGFRGVLVLHDGAERALGITFWESEEHAKASDEALSRFRSDVSRAVESTPLNVESYSVELAVGPAFTQES